MCCQCARFGAVIYLNFSARALSVIRAFLIVWPAVCRQEVDRSAALYSNHVLSILGAFLILSRVWQVLCASAIASIAFFLPVRAMCPMCVAVAVVLLLCVLPFSHLLLSWLSPLAVQMLFILQRAITIILLCLYHLLCKAPRPYEVRRFLWVVIPCRPVPPHSFSRASAHIPRGPTPLLPIALFCSLACRTTPTLFTPQGMSCHCRFVDFLPQSFFGHAQVCRTVCLFV